MNNDKKLPANFTDMSRFEKEPDITQKKRDTLLHFNTHRFWHCFYDSNTKILYDEYGYKLMDNAESYLVQSKMIDNKGNFLRYFEE